ncbi:MAG: toll/interleukin-1 receptor domain-containing protein [Candidatus Cloacimonadota bacterium]|nr:toll/interleukin-1 receptor domain-containing protein [Candidatus Cloacimonadota bacterium]
MRTVFLSHSSIDKPAVRRISHSLESHGISVWLDEAEINVGDSLFQKIADAIESIDFVIAVISSSSVTSKWVQKELQLAMTKEILDQQVTVLPLVIDSCKIPFFISDKCYADFRDPETYDDSVEKLVRAILSDSVDSKSNDSSRSDSTSSSMHSKSDIGKVVYPHTMELYAIRANDRQNRYSESFFYLGFILMLLAFFVQRFMHSNAIGFSMLLGGCSVALVGTFLKIAFIKNKEAYARDPNIMLEIENIKGWNLPFGSKWKAQYKAGHKCTPFKHALIAETFAVIIMGLSLLFFAPVVVFMFKLIR